MYGSQGPQPPQDGAPQKKTKGKLWGCLGCGGLLVLLLFLAGGCMAIVSGDGDSGGTSEEEPSAGTDTDSDESGADDDQEKSDVAGVGDAVESGAFEFTVTDVETGVEQVGDNPYLTEQAQGQYVIVHVTVENIGDQAGTFDSTSQNLLDGDGNQYSTDTSAEIALDSDSFLNEINPGNKVEGKLVYDVPADVKPDLIELQDFLSFDSPAEVELS